MLTLTRKKDQTVDIGHGLVVIKVKKITGSSVMLSIDAPREVSINRGEVETGIAKERPDAA